MKIFLEFVLKNNYISKKYRSAIVSFFKKSFSNSYKALYDKYYSQKYSIKNFTFSVFFKNPKFIEDKIILEENTLKINFSILDISDGIDIYNAFLKMKNVEYNLFDENTMTLKSIRLENHKTITKDTIFIKMLSPLVVRTHLNGKNTYLNFEEVGFVENLNKSIEYVLSEFTSIDLSTMNFEFSPVYAKKTVVNAFGTNITANLGIYKIIADIDVINSIYQLGIGSRRSEGFGMFEIIT